MTTTYTTRAITTHERAVIRCGVALREYRRLRRWHIYYLGHRDRCESCMKNLREAIAARARWSTLAELLAAEAAETTVAA